MHDGGALDAGWGQRKPLVYSVLLDSALSDVLFPMSTASGNSPAWWTQSPRSRDNRLKRCARGARTAPSVAQSGNPPSPHPFFGDLDPLPSECSLCRHRLPPSVPHPQRLLLTVCAVTTTSESDWMLYFDGSAAESPLETSQLRFTVYVPAVRRDDGPACLLLVVWAFGAGAACGSPDCVPEFRPCSSLEWWATPGTHGTTGDWASELRGRQHCPRNRDVVDGAGFWRRTKRKAGHPSTDGSAKEQPHHA